MHGLNEFDYICVLLSIILLVAVAPIATFLQQWVLTGAPPRADLDSGLLFARIN